MKTFVAFVFSLLSLTGYAIKPDREYKINPEMFGLKYSEYQLKTIDNYLINVWEYKLPDSVAVKQTIILVGTDAGNMSHMIWDAKALLQRGIRVIAFDYRGFGKSSDFEINKDFLFYPEFAVDLDTVIRAARIRFPKDHVGLLSLSMGTYISLIRKEKIDFLVAEGFYHNPKAVMERIKVVKGGVTLLPAHTKNIIKLKPSAPVMIFCASLDKVTTIEEAWGFSRKNNVSIVEFDGEHLWGFQKFTKNEPGDLYVDKIVDFLKRNGI